MSMYLEQFLLGKLAEEASEVAKIALKSQQRGLGGDQNGTAPPNYEKLEGEVNDLFAALEMLSLVGFNYEKDREAMLKKRDQVAFYARLSVEEGFLDPSALLDLKNELRRLD